MVILTSESVDFGSDHPTLIYLPDSPLFVTISLLYKCARGAGDDWVPGGGGRRTVSDPEGSSTKAYPSGDQDHLVVIGPTGTFFVADRQYYDPPD